MLRCAFTLAVLLCFTSPTSAAVPAVSPDPKSLIIPEGDLSRARDLVQKLGSEQYAEREDAETSLSKMGRLARPALLDGANNDTNAEIRSRCQGLLPRATTLEMKARLAVFLADAEGKFEHDLAGWNEFRTLVRKQWTVFGHLVWSDRSLDSAARTLFADMISTQTNRQILFAIGEKQSELSSLAGNRRQELYWQKYPRAVFVGGAVRQPAAPRDPSVSDIVTLLLLEVEAGSFAPPRMASMSTLLTNTSFRGAAVAGDDRAKVCQAVLAAWFDTRQDAMEMYQAMSIAQSLGIPEQGAHLAARLLQAKGAQPVYRGLAAATLVRSGNKSHLPLLEKAFDDKSVVYTVRKMVPGKPPGEWETQDIQLRDIALVVSVILTQQKPEDYWFVDQQRGNGMGAANYNYTRYHISDKLRDMALAKWNEWRENNP